MYVTAQDPIRIGGGFGLYNFVKDTNSSFDWAGLNDCSVFDDLAKLRQDLGLEGGALARLDINGKPHYGINTWKTKTNKQGKIVADDNAARKAFEDAGLVNPSTGKVPISTFTNHAEGDVFLQAFKGGNTQGQAGKLFVDRDICGWCKPNLSSMKEALGLSKLEVFEKINGQIVKSIL
jgi:hypothetical protein